MDRRVVSTLLANDLRLLLRSGRTLFMSVVLPLLLFPVMLLLSSIASERQIDRRESTVYQYVVTGPEASEARRWLTAARERLADLQARGAKRNEGTEEDEDDEAEPFRFEEATTGDPEAALAADELHFFVAADLEPPEAPEGKEGEEEEQGEQGEQPAPSPAPPLPDLVPTLTIHFRSDRDDSGAAGSRITTELARTRQEAWNEDLRVKGFPISPTALLPVETEDVATAERSSGLLLGRLLTTFLVMLLVSGGSVVAMDSLAGEKERGTLETLLTTAASRIELVTAKSLSVFVVGVVITIINIANLLIWVGLEVIPLPERFAVPVDLPVGLVLLVLYLPVAALISSLLMLVSGYAKTYKEAQLLLFPVTLLCMAITLVALMPGLQLRSPFAVVPVANVALAVKEILTGTWDWPFLVLAWATTTAAAVYLARRSARALSNERLMTAGDFDFADFLGGEAIYPRHVLRWFAVLWAVFLLVQLNFGPPKTDVRTILVFNMALFAVATLALVKRYRLNARDALSLRLPSLWVWPLVLVGVPAGMEATMAVAELSGLFFPIPEAWLEVFNQRLMPKDVPFWQLLLLLSVLPGICEELAFRGALLHGLRRRLSPFRLALAVGIVFGLFHVDLFRILPTAFLGVLLAGLTILSRSIFPAMLWHTLHNGLNVALSELAPDLAEPQRWLYLPSFAVLAAIFVILWRQRFRQGLAEARRDEADLEPDGN